MNLHRPWFGCSFGWVDLCHCCLAHATPGHHHVRHDRNMKQQLGKGFGNLPESSWICMIRKWIKEHLETSPWNTKWATENTAFHVWWTSVPIVKLLVMAGIIPRHNKCCPISRTKNVAHVLSQHLKPLNHWRKHAKKEKSSSQQQNENVVALNQLLKECLSCPLQLSRKHTCEVINKKTCFQQGGSLIWISH